MKNAGSHRRLMGFTLIEVIVALAIAATAMVLLLSVNHESLARSFSSRERARVTDAAQSKWESINAGLETGSQGTFDSLPGWVWSVHKEDQRLDALKSIERTTFQVVSPSGIVKLHWEALRFKGLPPS